MWGAEVPTFGKPRQMRTGALAQSFREQANCCRSNKVAFKRQDGGLRHLRIGIECHACFQWLLPAIEEFNCQHQGIEIDLQGENLFDGIGAIERQSLDLLFTDDRIGADRLHYELIGEFRLVLAMGLQDSLTSRPYVQPEDLRDKRLLTYPVPLSKLDVFRLF